MGLQKPRQFSYRPPERRKKQLADKEGEEFRPRIELPKAGDGRTSLTSSGGMFSGGLRLLLMLIAIVGLALVFASLR
ncbi:MAG TPA: hypothetical protein ENN56_03220 [Firmicutes bacterium]|nr:hypothetical protein [Bacillota bacterium]